MLPQDGIGTETATKQGQKNVQTTTLDGQLDMRKKQRKTTQIVEKISEIGIISHRQKTTPRAPFWKYHFLSLFHSIWP
jgi:hypothetical protein